MLLTTYVDDFKLAGPKHNLPEGWKLLRKHLSIEDPKPVGLYLGCHHDVSTVRHTDVTNVVVMRYNM